LYGNRIGCQVKRRATEAIALQFHSHRRRCRVRCPQRKIRLLGKTTLEPLQAIVALTEEVNLNPDVTGKTRLSDWR
jgi:extradiol dioxygenase family protein